MLATTEGTGRQVVAWHGLTAEEVCKGLGVDPRQGLSPGEVERRRAEVGPNKLAEAEKEPGWHAFLRQYRDLMQLVLARRRDRQHRRAAGVRSTGIVIVGLTVLNAVLGLNQEGKAAESVAALQKMLVIQRARPPRRRARRTSRRRSSCRATSSPSRRATRSRPTAA